MEVSNECWYETINMKGRHVRGSERGLCWYNYLQSWLTRDKEGSVGYLVDREVPSVLKIELDVLMMTQWMNPN